MALFSPHVSHFLLFSQIQAQFSTGRKLCLQYYTPANSQAEAGRQQRQVQWWQTVSVTEGTDTKNSVPYLTQSTSDRDCFLGIEILTILKYPGVMNLVTCESENSHLLCFRFVSTWFGSILQINNELLNKPDFPAKFTPFFLLFLLAWCTIPWLCFYKAHCYYRWLLPKTKTTIFLWESI